MLDGTYEGLTGAEILVHLAATRPDPAAADAGENAADAATGDEPARPAPTDEPDDVDGSGDDSPSDGGSTDGGPRGGGPTDGSPGRAGDPADREAEGTDPSSTTAELTDPDLAAADPADVQPAAAELLAAARKVSPERRLEIARREPPRYGVELQVRLSTLLDLDEFPAALAAHGPIHPAYARDLANDLGAAQWRYAVTDPEGRLLTAGLTTARPPGLRRRTWRSRAIVELQIPETLLADLLTGERGATVDPAVFDAWRPVLADIASRIQPRGPPGENDTTRPDDARRRFPRAALRRDVQIRKRVCTGPGCRAPAATADIDHTIDHGHGGPTIDWNLGPKCRHDHTLKHRAGWTQRLTAPDTYLWTSRLGHPYKVTTPTIIEDLPDPQPSDDQPEIYVDEPKNPATVTTASPGRPPTAGTSRRPPGSGRLPYPEGVPPPRRTFPRPDYGDEPPFSSDARAGTRYS